MDAPRTVRSRVTDTCHHVLSALVSATLPFLGVALPHIPPSGEREQPRNSATLCALTLMFITSFRRASIVTPATRGKKLLPCRLAPLRDVHDTLATPVGGGELKWSVSVSHSMRSGSIPVSPQATHPNPRHIKHGLVSNNDCRRNAASSSESASPGTKPLSTISSSASSSAFCNFLSLTLPSSKCLCR